MGRRTMVASAEPKLTEKLKRASAELKKGGLSEELKGAGLRKTFGRTEGNGGEEDLRKNRTEAN